MSGAILIRIVSQVTLIDTGRSGKGEVGCFYKSPGIIAIGNLILTHPHSDHTAGAVLNTLAPAKPLTSGAESDLNNNSIVAKLVFGKFSLLIAGRKDAGRFDEKARLATGFLGIVILPADDWPGVKAVRHPWVHTLRIKFAAA